MLSATLLSGICDLWCHNQQYNLRHTVTRHVKAQWLKKHVYPRENNSMYMCTTIKCVSAITTTQEGRKTPMQVTTPNLNFAVPKFALVFFHSDPRLPKHIWLTTLFSVLFSGHNKQGSDLTTNSVLRDYLWWCSGCHTWSQASCV